MSAALAKNVACGKGQKWDTLVNSCVPLSHEKPQQVTAPPPVRLTHLTPCPNTSTISTSVWVSVAVVISISLLVLLLWFLIFRRERMPILHAEAGRPTEAEADRGQTAMALEEEETPEAFPHQNGGPLVSTWREAVRCDDRGEGSAHMCNGRKEHGIPLPATELGDAALVTTKTVQQAN